VVNSIPDEPDEYMKNLYKRCKLKGFEKCPECCLADICHCKKSQLRRCKDCGTCSYVVEVKKKVVNGKIKADGVQMTLKMDLKCLK
jgi:hypothetical protein